MTVFVVAVSTRDGRDRTARTHCSGESEAKWIFMIKKKGTQSPEKINLNGNFVLGP